MPVYTHNIWQVFVDLGAYREDVTELADPERGMEHMAQVALYMIAERLLYALTEGDDEEDEEDEDTEE